MPRRAFDAQAGPGGALVAGSPDEVTEKLLAYHEAYGVNRMHLQVGFGGVPQKDRLTAVELLGTEVLPVLKREIAGPTPTELFAQQR